MTRPENPGTPDSRDELRLRNLLESTMAGVEPDDRLSQIRSRTKVTAMSTRPSWLWGAGGAAIATAAVITAVAMIGNPLKQTSDPGPLGTPTVTDTQTSPTQATEPTEPTQTVVPGGPVVGVYYLGDTPRGLRLYREFQVAVGASDPLTGAVNQAVSAQPVDPDYSNPWPAGTQAYADYNGDVITVTVESADAGSGNLHDRPAGMSQEEAGLAIQQVIYTAQGGLGEGRVPVQFLLDGEHTDQLLGEQVGEPLANDDPMSVLSLVNLSEPTEGQAVSYGGTLHVTGVACTFEANVPWTLFHGDEPIVNGFFTAAEGCGGVKLFAFEDDIELGQLSRGTYTLAIQEDDPSGGEGPGPMSDTRTIVVE